MSAPVLRPARPADSPELIRIWRSAVDATHHFLSPADRSAIDAEVCAYLPGAPLVVATIGDDVPAGFIHAEDGHIHALFVDAAAHGRGIGRRLVAHAVAAGGPLIVEVNAQNDQGVGFYRHLGFRETARSPHDDQGRPYPLILMRRD